ncbi:hypothetical protein BJ944DRAFT_232204 [Cunninghamella echinulata]|nr:hypothetical protein BJ944DRAFT_232204 [Cunninghamella echinulata]
MSDRRNYSPSSRTMNVSDDDYSPRSRDKFRRERSLDRNSYMDTYSSKTDEYGRYARKKRQRRSPSTEERRHKYRRSSPSPPSQHSHHYYRGGYSRQKETRERDDYSDGDHYIPNYERDGYTPGARYGGRQMDQPNVQKFNYSVMGK